MDATTKALIETIGAAGFAVMIGADRDGNSVVEATNERTGQRFVVRAVYPYLLSSSWGKGSS